MWNVEFTDDREIVFSKIKNNKKHVINKFWDEDPGVCWWHVYIVEPDTPFGDCVWGEISPTLRRITALPNDEYDTSYWEESETVADLISRFEDRGYTNEKFYITSKNGRIGTFEVDFKDPARFSNVECPDFDKVLRTEIEGWVFLGSGGIEVRI